MQAQFRNPMTEVPSAALWIRCQVQRFLRNKHPMHHRVYNLCKEKNRRCFISLSNLSASYQPDAFYESRHRHNATFEAIDPGSPSMTTLSVPYDSWLNWSRSSTGTWQRIRRMLW